ncbi:MAG TPA: hypothetical protein VK452_02825 [Dissulfurispiraceae bacterium]|nr:hypothetical protein [Dissulfurispiraceae bacterium]
MARPGAYKSEKRKKELNRLKKQEEKRQKRLNKGAEGHREGETFDDSVDSTSEPKVI